MQGGPAATAAPLSTDTTQSDDVERLDNGPYAREFAKQACAAQDEQFLPARNGEQPSYPEQQRLGEAANAKARPLIAEAARLDPTWGELNKLIYAYNPDDLFGPDPNTSNYGAECARAGFVEAI